MAVTAALSPNSFPQSSTGRLEVSSLLGLSPDGVPIVDRSEAQSRVTVQDGHTLVMGGLIQDEKIETINRVPILGRIPLIKYLFRSRSVDNAQSELLLFVSPTITDTGSTDEPPDQIELGPSRIELD